MHDGGGGGDFTGGHSGHVDSGGAHSSGGQSSGGHSGRHDPLVTGGLDGSGQGDFYPLDAPGTDLGRHAENRAGGVRRGQSITAVVLWVLLGVLLTVLTMSIVGFWILYHFMAAIAANEGG